MTRTAAPATVRRHFPAVLSELLAEAGYKSAETAIHTGGQFVLMQAASTAFVTETASGPRLFLTLEGTNATVAEAAMLIDAIAEGELNDLHTDANAYRADDAGEVRDAIFHSVDMGETRALVDEILDELDGAVDPYPYL